MKHRYISRYEKEKGGGYTFCGWRLCITRCKERYVKYYSDRQFGGNERSLAAALTTRDRMLAEMENVAAEHLPDYFRACRRRDSEAP